MRIVALNLRQGGGTRVPRLVEYLCGTGADVVVAGEFVPGPRGDALTEGLRAGGFSSFHSPGPPRDGYGVLLASRTRSVAIRLRPAPADRGRIVAARTSELIIAGVYFSLGKEKASLFDYLLSRPPDLGDSFLVLGDFNTGIHHLDEPAATLDCADRFALLASRGYVDLWRRLHGAETRETSWISQRGLGYRLDHAFGAGPVVDRVTACRYDHAPRGAITDHSALLVELA